MIRRLTIVIPLLVFGVSGCGWIGHDRVNDAQSQGRVADNMYTSPGETFRIRIPELSANATLNDERPTPYTTLVTIEDDLCREFIVSERRGFLGEQSLDGWVDEHIVQGLERLGFAVQRKPLTTRYGTVMALRYQAPAAAPCNQTREVDGKQIVTKRDADVGWYVFHYDDVFYRLIYFIGTGEGTPSLWYIKREPVDEVLGQFADGFEILGVKDAQTGETK